MIERQEGCDFVDMRWPHVFVFSSPRGPFLPAPHTEYDRHEGQFDEPVTRVDGGELPWHAVPHHGAHKDRFGNSSSPMWSHALSYNLGPLTGGARCSLEFGCGSGLFSIATLARGSRVRSPAFRVGSICIGQVSEFDSGRRLKLGVGRRLLGNHAVFRNETVMVSRFAKGRNPRLFPEWESSHTGPCTPKRYA
jgi:hypothetical protein